ncbi:MAG: type II toxin-antitoxin system RelE/ParE family toxin [Nitrospirae bacterium]|nr:type II toxin-antitoxin system RelE/ParE family toxin [Nitrospirota bacterium]MBF0521342.1 type II toxin-antitoxin system RelE/ParE family toxin [Nitrospirota bacterium]MBF0535731.1 type II toxin-antitoxin system RelE/ParE family toxin [Nitrospirota bacterium]MBF0617556.1 type II toxin-antitoxin system RelE/ParE family toxin [Nitrospirota bacterium]
MLKLQITRQASDFLYDLDPKQFRQVTRKVLSLMENPEQTDSAALKGYPFKRVDVGEYRIIYRTEADTLKISLIGKCNDNEIYNMLKNMVNTK